MPKCSTCCAVSPVFSSAQLKRKSAERRCVECVHEPCFDEKRKELCLWLLKHGATLKVSMVDFDGYRCLKTTSRVAKHEELVFIPLRCMMTMTDAKKCALVQSLKDVIVTPQTYLALYLLEEKRKHNASFFYTYISLLPKHYKDMPVCFDRHQINFLKNSICESMLLTKQHSLAREFATLVGLVDITFDEFVWARTAVITRVFNCKINKKETECLVPIADMMNHAKEPSTQWEFDSERDGFTMASVRMIPSALQLYDSYGDKCNSRYFGNYGFTLADNHNSNQAAIFFELPNGFVLAKTNYDDGFSGYTYCVDNKLIENERLDKIRFQVPMISEHVSKPNEALIRSMFGFARMCASGRSQDFDKMAEIGPMSDGLELEALEIIGDAAQKARDLLPHPTDPRWQALFLCEITVLDFYIQLADFAKTNRPEVIRRSDKFHWYWNMFYRK